MKPQKAVVVSLAWLVGLSGAVVVMLAEALPFRLTFITPENFFLCLLQCQGFFVVFVWPLFLPWLLSRPPGPAGAPESKAPDGRTLGDVFVLIGVLWVVALPLALVGANVSNVGFAGLLGAQLRVGAAAALVAAIFLFGAALNRSVAPGYFLGAFVLSSVPPFLHYEVREAGLGTDLEFLSWASPFWGALDRGGPAWSQAGVFAALAGALLLLASRRRPPVPGPSPATPA